MALEQFDLQDYAKNTSNQSLNFLNIHESAPPAAQSGVETTKLTISPEAGSQLQVIDFSAPLFPGETAEFGNPEDDFENIQTSQAAESAKPPNKYEATVKEQVAGLDSEAQFTVFTRDALNRDADRFPAVRNEKDGTTTYTIEQFGLTDRDLTADSNSAEPYKRLVSITVADNAGSLKDCQFEYQDRQKIDMKEFDQLVKSAQKRQAEQSSAADAEHKLTRPDDMAFYTHGIRTAAVSSDFFALALQLTEGHSVINVDWKSTAPAEQKSSMSDAYNAERKQAAESYGRFEKALDDTVSLVGAEHTDMIAFSHGAMFDTRYLQHRKDSSSPMLNEVIFTHPDVPIAALPQPDADGNVDPAKRLYSCVAKSTHVIGSTADLAMTGAAYTDCEPSKSDKWVEQFREKQRQMAIHARIGDGGNISRNLVAGSGGIYVMETIPQDKKDPLKHFINMHGISGIINTPDQKLRLANKTADGEK